MNLELYFLSLYVYFIKRNVPFLCISEYPHELHDPHKDYPHTSERLQIEENILSDYQRHLLQDEGFNKPPPKLVPNLRKLCFCLFTGFCILVPDTVYS